MMPIRERGVESDFKTTGSFRYHILCDVLSIRTVLTDFVADFLATTQRVRALNDRDVEEHVATTVIGDNEAKAFFLIEEFYDAGGHDHFRK